MPDYGKAMVAAQIFAKYCKGYGFDYNRDHFVRVAPVGLCGPDKLRNFMETRMIQTRKKINAYVGRIGIDNYCMNYTALVKVPKPPNELPIRFTHCNEQ